MSFGCTWAVDPCVIVRLWTAASLDSQAALFQWLSHRAHMAGPRPSRDIAASAHAAAFNDTTGTTRIGFLHGCLLDQTSVAGTEHLRRRIGGKLTLLFSTRSARSRLVLNNDGDAFGLSCEAVRATILRLAFSSSLSSFASAVSLSWSVACMCDLDPLARH